MPIMEDLLVRFFLLGCSTAALARLITAEGGPWGILKRLRQEVKTRWPNSQLADGISCAICAGFWIALILTPVALLWPVVLLPFAAMGLAYAFTGLGSLWTQPNDTPNA